MLIELRIQNYAVIEHLSVRLEPGFNALTGETGAGKSIIVGALSLLLGERASSEDVRPGTARAVVEAVFDVSDQPEVLALLDEHGHDAADGLLILRREVAAEGRNRAWVNGGAATAGLVGELGRSLVDLHGQHEHQALLRPDEQRRVLDAFAGASGLAEEVRSAWTMARDCEQRLQQLELRARDIAQRSDYLRFQVSEIERAAPRPGEDEALSVEARRLEHADELARTSELAHQQLYAGEHSITSRLGELRRTLQGLARLDPGLGARAQSLDEAFYLLEEIGRDLGAYSRSVDHDPARLEAVRQRQDLIYRLESRYGPGIEDVLATLAAAQSELATLDNVDAERQALQQEHTEAVASLQRLAGDLSKARRQAASRLAGELAALLPELGMSGRFEVALTPLTSPGVSGAEQIEFLMAANQGFEPRALARVASGGELSRLMLALKAVVARADAIPTLVFDEIDVGIGGRVAHQVGARLRGVAASHQVFAITHLAQIAARAEHHLLVEKQEADGSTSTTVTELQGDARVRELARLLGGDPDSTSSLGHARELLAMAAG
jgi:DNA repair protein RecN (Recombination protein N)